MSIPKEIQALSGSFEERLRFSEQILQHPEQSKKDDELVNTMLQTLESGTAPHAVRTSLVYLLSKLHVEKAIPTLIELLENDFPYLGDSPGYLNFDAVNGLLEFGEEAVPALEKHLAGTRRPEVVLLLATMLYNICGDKSRVRNMLEGNEKNWSGEGQPPYGHVLGELDKM